MPYRAPPLSTYDALVTEPDEATAVAALHGESKLGIGPPEEQVCGAYARAPHYPTVVVFQPTANPQLGGGTHSSTNAAPAETRADTVEHGDDAEAVTDASPEPRQRAEQRARTNTVDEWESANFVAPVAASTPHVDRVVSIGNASRPTDDTLPHSEGQHHIEHAQNEALTSSTAQTEAGKDKNTKCTVKLKVFLAGEHDNVSHFDLVITFAWLEREGDNVVEQKTKMILSFYHKNVENLTYGGFDEITPPFNMCDTGSVIPSADAFRVDFKYNSAYPWCTNVLNDVEFGPFQDRVDCIRSCMAHGARISFVAHNAGGLIGQFNAILEKFGTERVTDPYNAFWTDTVRRPTYHPIEVLPRCNDREKVAPVRTSFRDMLEFTTHEIVGLVRDHQWETARANNEHSEERARFLRIPGNEHSMLLLVDEDDDDPIGLQKGEQVDVRIHALNRENIRENDWTGTVISPVTTLRATDTALIVTRRFDMDTEQWRGGDIDLLGNIPSINDVCDGNGTALVDRIAPKAVDIYVRGERESFKRRYLTVLQVRRFVQREKQFTRSGVSVVEDLVLGIRFDRLPSINMLESLDGTDIDAIKDELSPSQHAAVDGMCGMPGGLHFVQGAAGSGKSLVVVTVLAHIMRKERSNANAAVLREPLRALITSPLNSNADQISLDLESLLLRESPDAIVLRKYTKDTDRGIFFRHIEDAIQANRPRALDRLAAEGDSRGATQAAIIILDQIFEGYNRAYGKDRRVQEMNMRMSPGAWALQLIGVSARNTPKASTTALERLRAIVGEEAITGLRNAYNTYSDNNTDPEAKGAASRALQAVFNAIYNAADAVLCTTQQAASPDLTAAFHPRFFVLDEAAKTSSAESFVWAWYPGCKYRIFAGDTTQSRSQVRSPPTWNVFCNQMAQSHFSRLMLSGYPSTYQLQQFRYVDEISQMISRVFYHDRLERMPRSVASELEGQQHMFRTFLRRVHCDDTMDGSVLLVNVKDSSENTLALGKSKYNTTTALATWNIVTMLENAGFKGEDIGIVTHYVGQRTVHEGVRNKRKLSQPTRDMSYMIETSERAQGQQRAVLVFDLPNTATMGFAGGCPRTLVGLTRCRIGLVLVMDVAAIEALRGVQSKALGKVLKWCKEAGKVVDIAELTTPSWFVVPDVERRSDRGQIVDAVQARRVNLRVEEGETCEEEDIDHGQDGGATDDGDGMTGGEQEDGAVNVDDGGAGGWKPADAAAPSDDW